MIDWLQQNAAHAPYLVIFGILLATGFGLPMPEDIPLLIGGYLCGLAAENGQMHPNLWIMLPGVMIAIVGSDVVLFYIGMWIGPSIHRHPILKRMVGNRNLARAKVLFNRHHSKFVFFARFLPGVRAPAFFTAGTFKMPLRKFLFWDGLAAMLSAPWAVLLGYIFHEKIKYAENALKQGKTIGFVIIAGVILFFVLFHLIIKRYFINGAGRHKRAAHAKTSPASPENQSQSPTV